MSGGFRCGGCQQVYPADPGVCGMCSGSFFEQIVPTSPELGEEASAPTGATTTVEHMLCTRSDCALPIPTGQSHCDYCGEPAPAAQPHPRLTEPTPTPTLVAPDGTTIELREGVPVVLGRNPQHSPWARLAESNLKVSGRHAEVVLHRGVLHVRDLGSTNGTWVRGIRIDGAASVPVEDGIVIGLSRHLELEVRTP
ncbi:FHA domain-containing protein [Aeromicrobium duanguangcaii]|uniref:FHA domain-containing protein n=1 Tax=Aeromicrobium duanguangcaii TaxID=2968086 RepID=A0ABY5KCP5_9ACTN|nr:FHA domain-containing protein [Aeromicrobium duanguangcaii]MCD9152792.1 FHA domain-containing protein [Aeromicrobium duanguangcaii]UUI67226.1 FHA domain-containing protein [Aeromicrobium duanguangcaii]